MTEQEYNQHEGIRRSDLWKVRESPEKYLWSVGHPEPPTPALMFGSMVHKLLLQPNGFGDEYVVAPTVDKRTRDGREAWQKFTEENAGKIAVSAEDLKTATDMVMAVERHPIARKLLSGQPEKPIFWTDEDTGELIKCRLDMLTDLNGKPVVVDYKTAISAQTDQFNHAIFKHGYALQAYMYTEAVMHELHLTERPDFIFIVQEKKPPYSVNVIKVSDDVMLNGMDTFRELIGVLHQCLETGYFYGYTGPFDDVNETYLPGWITMGEEDD